MVETKLRGFQLLRTHSSPKGLTSNNEAGQRGEMVYPAALHLVFMRST
jgi:hypothetical protein